MGAVMGSKNLKAIAVRGQRHYPFFDADGVKSMAQDGVAKLRQSNTHQALQQHGTAISVETLNKTGNIVTRNFQSGYFEQADEISGTKMTETILKDRDTCWGCSVRCKRVVELERPYKIDPQYGGPEFETIVMLGSNLGISDLPFIAKANEMCNKYGMDTISVGGMIAFAMECFEKGILTQKDTSGLELRFGNKEAALKLLKMIVFRQGIGDILADGPQKAVSLFGGKSRDFAIQAKNQPFPAHIPRVKQSQALIYAVNPFGADHMSSEHDWIAITDGDLARGLGITDFTDLASLDEAKVRATMLSQFYYSLLDTLTLCDFCWGPGLLFGYRDVENLIHAVTGWQVTFMELMRAGERRVNLMRAFNAREGFSRDHDTLPQRCFEPLSGGASEGRKVHPGRFEKALSEYYAMMNWDVETGNPTRGKLVELGLGWVVEASKLK
jgi:aldehyde:ferredoxin oxidoreductase